MSNNKKGCVHLNAKDYVSFADPSYQAFLQDIFIQAKRGDQLDPQDCSALSEDVK